MYVDLLIIVSYHLMFLNSALECDIDCIFHEIHWAFGSTSKNRPPGVTTFDLQMGSVKDAIIVLLMQYYDYERTEPRTYSGRDDGENLLIDENYNHDVRKFTFPQEIIDDDEFDDNEGIEDENTEDEIVLSSHSLDNSEENNNSLSEEGIGENEIIDEEESTTEGNPNEEESETRASISPEPRERIWE